MEILLRDLPFYRHSGGGVTFSGGEATCYPDYLEVVLERLKQRGVHLALETSGCFDYEPFEQKILPYMDLIYYDVKFADPEAHRRYTGSTNRRVLDNLTRLLREKGVEVHPRVPIVPGITATRENLSAIVHLLCKMGAEDVFLLPYNPMGVEMAVRLGRSKPSLPECFMKPEEEREIRDLFEAMLGKRREKEAMVRT